MKTLKLSFIFLLIISANVFAQNYIPGKVYYDEEKYTEFIVGDIPLVISIPHGGTKILADVPLRDCKSAVTVTDSRCIELGREIEYAFLKKYNVRPFIIICNLSRKNVDQNRDLSEGTCGNEAMVKPWNQFHDFIDTALAMATKKFGSALYIDLHGHGHKNQRLELGYSLSATDLSKLENDKNYKDFASKTTLTNLLVLNNNVSLEDLFIGNEAFGTLMANAGFPAVPSKQDVAPKPDEKYFNGGYNTRRYTSDKYPKVFGWQIESNYKGVRDAEGRPLFAKAFAEVIMDYFKYNTNIKIK